VASAHFLTEEGPVVVEQFADNTVVVSESFDKGLAAKIGDAVHDAEPGAHAENIPQKEIGLRLYEFPAFQRFAEQVGDAILREMRVQ
jgi:hypothetical protein